MIALTNCEATHVADWAELALSLGEEDLSKNDISRSMAFDEGGLDSRVDEAWAELRRRHRLYRPARYAFSVDGLTVEPTRHSGDSIYQVCLLLSLYGVEKVFPNSITADFELVSHHVFRRIAGASMHMGWAKTDAIYPPEDLANLQGRVNSLSKQLHLSKGKDVPASAKDERVDVVAWYDFHDGRTDGHAILAQVTCQKKWQDKSKPSLESWRQYISGIAGIRTAFVIPQVASSIPGDFLALQLDKESLILDRPRVVNALSESARDLDAALLVRLKAWVDTVVALIEDRE